MARLLNFHKPTSAELQALITLLETATDPHILKRAKVILWLCIAGTASEVAQIMDLHLVTVLRYVHAFNRRRLHWMTALQRSGPPRRISKRIEHHIVIAAQHEPGYYGLHYGTWSLSRLQWFITKKRKLLRRISREHLRRILKKTECTCGGSNARSIARIPSVQRF